MITATQGKKQQEGTPSPEKKTLQAQPSKEKEQ
jgi:hypothetical protein